jgi:hypothetical protein
MNYNCNICKKIYISQQSLCNHNKKFHSQTSIIKNNKNKNFICEYCNNKFITKQTLNNHLTICKIKKANLENQNILLEKSTPVISVTNNNLIMNHTTNHNYSSLLDYNDNYEKITEKFQKHYTIENLLKGDQRQLADMTVQHFLSGKDQPMYYITDRSRNKFMFTDKENNEKETKRRSF